MRLGQGRTLVWNGRRVTMWLAAMHDLAIFESGSEGRWAEVSGAVLAHYGTFRVRLFTGSRCRQVEGLGWRRARRVAVEYCSTGRVPEGAMVLHPKRKGRRAA